MHRRLWLLAGAAAAASVACGQRLRPRRPRWPARPAPTGRRVFRSAVRPGVGERSADHGRPQGQVRPGLRRGAGHRTGSTRALTCCNQLIGGVHGRCRSHHTARSTQNQKGSTGSRTSCPQASATKTSLSYTIKPNANWYWGGKKIPVTYKDFVYTLQKIDDPNERSLRAATGYSNIDHDELHPQGPEADHLPLEDDELHAGLPVRPVRELAEHLLRSLSVRRRSPARTSTRSGRTASAVATASPSPTARST